MLVFGKICQRSRELFEIFQIENTQKRHCVHIALSTLHCNKISYLFHKVFQCNQRGRHRRTVSQTHRSSQAPGSHLQLRQPNTCHRFYMGSECICQFLEIVRIVNIKYESSRKLYACSVLKTIHLILGVNRLPRFPIIRTFTRRRSTKYTLLNRKLT